jgi:hypothetical protein
MMGAGSFFIMPFNLTLYRHAKGGKTLLGVRMQHREFFDSPRQIMEGSP